MTSPGKYALAAALVPIALGCGLLGPKNDPSPNLDLSIMTGCLNSIGADIPSYLVGNVDSAKWASRFDCTVSLLNLFQRYTGPDRAFTPEEILSFVKLELVTNAPVSLELVRAAFELKASILGGSKDLVTGKELTGFTDVLKVLKTETTSMIPYFRYRASQPSPARMLELSRAIDASMNRISHAFDGRGTTPFSRKALETLVSEAVRTFKLPIPDNTPSTFLSTKSILFAGTPDAIEPESWIRLIQTAGTLGGPLIAAVSVQRTGLTQPNELGEFIHQLVVDARPLVDRGIALHGGAIDMSMIDTLVDSFTHGLQFGKLIVTPANAKSTINTVFKKIFRSAKAGVIDEQAVDSIMDFYDRWRRGQTHLETIFRNYGLDKGSVTGQLFASAARSYAVGLDMTSQADVDRLIQLATHFRPMFRGDDTEMSFMPTLQHSMGNIGHLNWMNLVADLILKSYASDKILNKLSASDWATMIGDFTPVAVDLGAIDPSVPKFAERRFREVDMFTFSSNGDTLLDIDELTYYLATITSLSATMNRVRADLEPLCSLHKGQDAMKWDYMDPACYRREFFARIDKYWDKEPMLFQQYGKLNASDKALFQRNTEQAARLHGPDDSMPMGGYDAKGYILLMLLQEEFFARFDTNQHGWLNTEEAIASAAPMERFTANRANIDISMTSILEAIQTFVLDKGRVPKNDVGGVLEIGAWAAIRPFWNLHVERPAAYRTTCIFTDFGDGDNCR